MAFEISSFPGYLTEKVLMGIMAGCQTFHWGDSTLNTLFAEQHGLNLTGLSPRNSARVIALGAALRPGARQDRSNRHSEIAL